MDSTDLDMGEIFSDREEDEDMGAQGPLPDLPEATQEEGGDEQENIEALARLKDLSKGAGKKVIRRPQPKLDPTRLTGDRGIPILPRLFDKVKFKGKGHEAQDLAVIMRQMEHWGHRLFPKMPFDEVIERVEKLGSKKEVQTCVKKIRLDMPVLNDEFVGSDRDDEEEGEKMDWGETSSKKAVAAEDMWEELLMEEAELQGSQQAKTDPLQSDTALSQSGPSSSTQPEYIATPVRTASQTPGGFTPEQLERMERNKQIANEKRLRKLGMFSPAPKTPNIKLSTSDLLPPSQSQPGASQLSPAMVSLEPTSADDTEFHHDGERSEVIPQGPTQNICVDNVNQPDGQFESAKSRMSAKGDSGANQSADSSADSVKGASGDSEITRGSYENKVRPKSKGAETDGENDSETSTKQSIGSKDMPKPLQEAENRLVGSDSDMNAMSEVVPCQGNDKDIPKAEHTKMDFSEEEKENASINDCKKNQNVKEVDRLPDMTGDNKLVLDEFDDDLTEDQLMET